VVTVRRELPVGLGHWHPCQPYCASEPLLRIVRNTGSTLEVNVPGPYVHAALFCEKVLVEPDSTLSAIRIVDKVNVTYEPTIAMPVPVSLFLLVSLRFGDTRPRRIEIEVENPIGERSSVLGAAAPQDQEGANIYGQLNLKFARAGDYWFRILADGVEYNRTMLTIEVQRPAAPPPTGGTQP
jgi:uncharacterized protein DUF6941